MTKFKKCLCVFLQIQVTCLELTKEHMSKIVKGLRATHIKEGEISPDSPSSTVDQDNLKEDLQEDRTEMEKEPGKFYVTECIDLTELFCYSNSENFGFLIRFFFMLAQYEKVREKLETEKSTSKSTWIKRHNFLLFRKKTV